MAHASLRRLPVATPTHAVDPVADAFELGQVPPSDLDIEGAILSSLLMDDDGSRWARVAPLLRAEHFYGTANQRVFEAIEQLRNEGKPADPVLVAGYMRQHGTLTQSGGAAYIAETLALTQPACARPELFALELVELWKRRQLVAACTRVVIKLRGGGGHQDAYTELREHFRSCK
jgi:replicative DNA helicase